MAHVEVLNSPYGGSGLFLVTATMDPAIVRVPESKLLTIRAISSDPDFTHILELTARHGSASGIPPDELESLVIIIYLVVQKSLGAGSKIYDYIQTIPSSYSTTAYWPDAFLERIAGSPLYSATISRKHDLQQLFTSIQEAMLPILPPTTLSWENFLWAATTIDSRAFRLLVDGRETIVLAPLADMINHSFQGQITSKRFDDASRQLILSAASPVAPGELFTSYGDIDNARLLLFYGFSVEDNPHDKVELFFEPPDGDANVELKVAALSRLGVSCSCELGRDLGELPAIVMALRILLLDDTDETVALLSQLLSGAEPLNCFEYREQYPLGGIVNVDHEHIALDTLANTLAELYQQYAAMAGSIPPGLYPPAYSPTQTYLQGLLDILASASARLGECGALL